MVSYIIYLSDQPLTIVSISSNRTPTITPLVMIYMYFHYTGSWALSIMNQKIANLIHLVLFRDSISSATKKQLFCWENSFHALFRPFHFLIIIRFICGIWRPFHRFSTAHVFVFFKHIRHLPVFFFFRHHEIAKHQISDFAILSIDKSLFSILQYHIEIQKRLRTSLDETFGPSLPLEASILVGL